ncbi:MAG: hypothetical protein IKM02_01150 [Clostridia bacterium]|nr:hypothetical protein [Clostridia bacterium]
MKNKTELIKTIRMVISLVLIGCYFVGLVAMITFSFSTGLILWVISTLGGVLLLYWIRSLERRAAEAAEAEKNAKEMKDAETASVCEGENDA